MKLITIFIIAFCSAEAVCQTTPTQVVTTNDEYNYLVNPAGLKETIEAGRDPKSGYTLKDEQPIKFNTYEFTFRPFIKNETKQMVALSIVIKSSAWGNPTYYIAIPRNNSELFSKYQQSISNWDMPLTRAYAYLTSALLGEAMGELEPLEKK